MNQSNDLLDKLDAQFSKLKDMQKGIVLSNVLLEYVKPDAIKVANHIFSEDHPRKWRRIQTLGDPCGIGYTKEGSQVVYSSLVVPYKDEIRILTGTEEDIELPEGLSAVREQLNLCLELAGHYLSRLSDRQSLPVEVSICENPSLSWLLLLHYITKPKRYIWTRIQRDDKDMDSDKHIGNFSFDVLQENSYSVIRDIANSSVLVISQLKSGLLSPDEENYTIGQLIKDLLSYEAGIERSRDYTQKQAGKPAIKGTAAGQYAVMAAVSASDAYKVRESIPSDASDFIKPLCESQGEEFNSTTLKTLRGKLCIQSGEGVPAINAMSLIDFNKHCSDLLSQRERTDVFDTSKKGENVSVETDEVKQENDSSPVFYDDNLTLEIHGKTAKFNRTQYRLITYLYSKPRRSARIRELIAKVWEKPVSEKAVQVAMNRCNEDLLRAGLIAQCALKESNEHIILELNQNK